MNELIGKWVMAKDQPFPGLWFVFHPDGTYQAELPGLIEVKSAGTYVLAPGGLIEMDQQEHSMGLVGHFSGRYKIEGNTLRLALSAAPGGPRPEHLDNARIYLRQESA
jgi:hypothetical protein